jgi:twinkle protein
MTIEVDSELVQSQLPCSNCGSSDALSLYSDGHTYCFSCKNRESDASPRPPQKAQKNLKELIKVTNTPGWKSRGLTQETCRKWGISLGEFSNKTVRCFNYKDKDGSTVGQKLRFANKEFTVRGSLKDVGLYGQHLWRDAGKLVVITEGEIDAASVSQVQNHKWPVVSLPNGASSASKSIRKSLDWLQNFETVVLMFDNDKPGKEAAKSASKIFKPGQCKVASLPLKDANDMLLAGRGKEIVDAIWSAKIYRPDGIILGNELWDTINESDDTFSLSYPWQGLQDSTLGCRLGELVTITAGSGVGKSSIIREMAYHLAFEHKEPIGMLMFEETVKRTALGLVGCHMSKPLTLIKNPQDTEGFEDAFDEVLGTGRISLYDHFGSTSIENVLDRIRFMAQSLGARWIFLDHLSIIISGMGDGDERRLIDNAMTQLKSLAMELNVGLFLVSHLKRPAMGKGHENGAQTSLGQLRGSHAIGQLSDIVIGAERDQQSSESDITTIRILKNRWTGKTGLACQLRYDHDTGRISETALEETFGDDDGETEDPF